MVRGFHDRWKKAPWYKRLKKNHRTGKIKLGWKKGGVVEKKHWEG